MSETRSARKLVDKTIRAYERESLKRESEERLRNSEEAGPDVGRGNESGAAGATGERGLEVTARRTDATL